MTCPGCGFDQWKSARLVHMEGSSTIASSSVGVGVTSGGSMGVGAASSCGVQQTQLAKLATPPTPFLKTGACVGGAFITVLLGLAASWWWWWTALFVVGVVVFYRSEAKEDEILSERYKNTRMCTRCGTFYVHKGTN
jgi:hypothetical protein